MLDGGSDSLVANRDSFFFVVIGGKKPEQTDERITLEPDNIISAGGTSHTVIATLVDNIKKQPIVGREVSFRVVEGPNVDVTGTVITDVNGKAFFTYPVNACVGTDRIQAQFLDSYRNEKLSIVSRTTEPTLPVASFTAIPNSGTFPLTVNLDASSSTAYCGGGSITSYQWQSDDGQPIAPGAISSITYTQAGTYTITLVVTDNLGATHSVPQTITVSAPPPPVARFTATPSSGAAPLMVALDGSSSTAYSKGNLVGYQWQSSDGQAIPSNAIASVTYNPGSHVIALTVTDNLGVTNTISQSVTVFRSNQDALNAVLEGLGATIEGRVITVPTADGKTHRGLLQEQITFSTIPSSDLFNPAVIPIEDANNDGIEDFLITYPSGNQQILYYFGTNTGANLGALQRYLEKEFKTEAVIINDDGLVLVTINDVLYEGQLDEEIRVQTPNTGFLHLVPYSDLDNDGVDDFVVVYPNGNHQTLFNRTLPLSQEIMLPPTEPTEISSVASIAEGIYTGNDRVQVGMNPEVIDPDKLAVLRGRVTVREGQPIFGVIITIDKHPEFGRTNTLDDGTFSLVVNGGELFTINYNKPGYLSAQRQVKTEAQGFFWADDVVMIPVVSSQTSPINLSSTNTEDIQVAQGEPVEERQATIFFPKDTTATSDGNPINDLDIQITEYTIEDNDLAAMPLPLPEGSGYTYAINVSANGSTDVQLGRTVPIYVNNFLDFPVGSIVPIGRLDENTENGWVPATNGRVVKVVGIDENGIPRVPLNLRHCNHTTHHQGCIRREAAKPSMLRGKIFKFTMAQIQ